MTWVFIVFFSVGTLLTALLFIFRITRTNTRTLIKGVRTAGGKKGKPPFLARWRAFLDAKEKNETQ